MSEEKKGLPPGPWRVEEWSILDANGEHVESDMAFRAVEALPLLVEAARRVVDTVETTIKHIPALHALRDALALVDGPGDGPPT